MKAVVVTGVSSGIGEGIARHLASREYTVFGSVRAPEHGQGLQEDLGSRFVPLVFDITDQSAVAASVEQVAAQVGDHGLRGLVNNAGIAVAGPLMHLDLDRFRRQFDVNLAGTLGVTQKFLPLLGARPDPPFPPGRIVNISSAGVSAVFAFSAPYTASKQALEGVSHGLRRELQVYGVDVVIVAPGVVTTPLWGKLTTGETDAFEGTVFASALARAHDTSLRIGQNGMPVERVARVVHHALEGHRPRMRYVVPTRRFSPMRLIRWVPARWLDRIIGRRLGLRPPHAP